MNKSTFSPSLKYFTLFPVFALAAAGCGAPETESDGYTDLYQEEEPADPAPEIEDVRPNKGPTTGGTVVEIEGKNFQDGILVYFASRESTDVDYLNPVLITARVPQGDAGTVTVKIENPDGQTAELAGGFTYEDVTAISWCSVDRPSSAYGTAGEETEPFYGIVEFPGTTDGSGRGDGIDAQAGFGPDDSDPQEDGDDWTWVDADYSADADGDEEGDLARDEYSAALIVDTDGSYDVAFRFSSDGWETWINCDMDASDFPEYDYHDAASLEISSLPETVDHCILHAPLSTSAGPSESTEMIYGKVRVNDYTDATEGALGFISAEVGYGPDGSNPESSAEWHWKGADFDEDTDPSDQYGAMLTAPASAGSYDYAYRFRAGAGDWTYCDSDGSDNGYGAGSAGDLTVEAPPPLVDWCRAQWPEETWTGPDFPTDPLYGHVFHEGVTEGGGAGSGITAEVGWGAHGSDPSSGGWTWVTASYLNDVDHLELDDADEYVTTLTISSAGDYSYAFRFSVDSGENWLFCDLDGSTDGYETGNAGYLRVVSTTVPIDWCNLQHPPDAEATLSGETEQIYGQVYSDSGGTSTPGRTMNIIAELGYGADGSDPTAAPGDWTWIRANYNTDVGSNDEFMAVLGGFSAAGTYDYAYRVTGDWGTEWTYCDLDGDDFPAYDAADAGDLTVTPD